MRRWHVSDFSHLLPRVRRPGERRRPACQPRSAGPSAEFARTVVMLAQALRRPVCVSLGRVRHIGEETGLSVLSDMAPRRTANFDPLKDGAASLIETQVEGYSAAGFTVNGVILPGAVFLLPQVSLLFEVPTLANLTPRSLEVLRLLHPPVEYLVVGTGRRLEPLPPATHEWLMQHCIAPESLPTRHACSTFNFMVAEGRQVAGVLFPVT